MENGVQNNETSTEFVPLDWERIRQLRNAGSEVTGAFQVEGQVWVRVEMRPHSYINTAE